MKFRYFLNGTEINEPIGMDGLSISIERTDHHGITPSVSVQKLGFYGNAIEIIQSAFDFDIDYELKFLAQMTTNDINWIDIYSGKLDLGTYELETGEKGCRINCNVGEIGVKTIFNNRYDTAVQMNAITPIDGGENLEPLYMESVVFPPKNIIERIKTSIEIQIDGFLFGPSETIIPFGSAIINELEGFLDVVTIGQDNAPIMEFQNYYDNIKISYNLLFDFISSFENLTGEIYIQRVTGEKEYLSNNFTIISSNNGFDTAKFQGDFTDMIFHLNDKIYATFYNKGFSDSKIIIDPTKNDNFFLIEGFKKTAETTHNVIIVKNAFSRISELISGLPIESDWLSQSTFLHPKWGDGSTKAILNGYELRKGNLTDGTRPPIQLSFKSLFESIDAIDNIGWGFSNENGKLVVRVERWFWFYNNIIILTIDNPNDKKRDIKTDKALTSLSIGYEKYMESDTINSIDTFHTKREYIRGIKAFDKKIEKISRFIADPYAIEMTRRRTLDPSVATQSWQYDDDVFIVCLSYKIDSIGLFLPEIEIGIKDIEDSTGKATLISPETVYNVRISPYRNALRHAEKLFSLNSQKNTLEFSSGIGNVVAKGRPYFQTSGSQVFLEDSASNVAVTENQPIQKIMPMLKPEIISFEFPFTFADYAAVLANPYGKVVVDGEECYISKIEASLLKGTAKFELIPVAND